MPINFWYYDPILNFVQEYVSQDSKDFHVFKNMFRLNFYEQENMKARILEKIGFAEKPGEFSNKLTYKYQVLNEPENQGINHHISSQVLTLQKSRYLIIDDDVDRLQEHFKIQSNNLRTEIAR